MSGYNYAKFSADDYEFDDMGGPKVGEKALDFSLTTDTGARRNLLDFSGDFLVLELGSITCPLFQGRRKGMAGIEDEFERVTSVVLYVREAHPGAKIPKHESIEDKRSCAKVLREEYGEARPILVDDFEGPAHQAYGGMPNAVFIINKNGCVVFRASWNNPTATRKALKALIAGKRVQTRSYFRPAPPPVVIRTLGRAGPGATADFLKSLPFLFWSNVIKRNLRLLFNPSGTVKGDMIC